MKAQGRYREFVGWEEEDGLYIGYCPDLFPWGGVCHATTEKEAYLELSFRVEEEVAQLRANARELPPNCTVPCARRIRPEHLFQ